MGNTFSKNKPVIFYGASPAGILFLLKWPEFRWPVQRFRKGKESNSFSNGINSSAKKSKLPYL